VLIEAKTVRIVLISNEDISHEVDNAQAEVELLAGAIDREIVVEKA
jgi:hypothetical protein